MDNETKISNGNLSDIMKDASEGKISPQEIIDKHLDERSAAKLKDILKDPQKLRRIMESPLAKRFMAAMSEKREEE